MTARAIMIQGTGSDVGKSLIVAGLARAFANRGLSVAPFKPQNMSNNAAVTAEGGEIGRAQALQARAARVPPSVHMNPLLLKPESATGSQVILRGHRVATLKARDFMHRRAEYLPDILESFRHLATASDLVLVEGAGHWVQQEAPGPVNDALVGFVDAMRDEGRFAAGSGAGGGAPPGYSGGRAAASRGARAPRAQTATGAGVRQRAVRPVVAPPGLPHVVEPGKSHRLPRCLTAATLRTGAGAPLTGCRGAPARARSPRTGP